MGAGCCRYERCNRRTVAAVAAHQQAPGDVSGSISFLITGDEEGPSINGTRKMLGWLQEQGEIIDDCLVGEPTNPDVLGDMIKIGRRGSVNGVVTVNGTQGHVAYPHLADNPVPQLVTLMAHLAQAHWMTGRSIFSRPIWKSLRSMSAMARPMSFRRKRSGVSIFAIMTIGIKTKSVGLDRRGLMKRQARPVMRLSCRIRAIAF